MVHSRFSGGSSWPYSVSVKFVSQSLSVTIAITRVSGQGWTDHLFASNAPTPRKEVVPCPEGAAREPGNMHAWCKCDFGHGGDLEWDPSEGKYFGECERTPCPEHAKAGEYAGSCECEAPYAGKLQWVAAPHHQFVGECSRVHCPDFSHEISSVEEVEVSLPDGHELEMEENAPGMLHSTLEFLYLKSIHWTPVIKVENEPRCECDAGYVGGYMWDYGPAKFAGGCLPVHPCPAGQSGASPATWIKPPWKREEGVFSSRLHPKHVGACRPAPCPAHAELDPSIGRCRCGHNFPGILQWNLTAEAYDGRCKAKFRCPANAVHRELPVSTTRYRLGCVCKDGFRGTWRRTKGRPWQDSCRRVDCPKGASWKLDHTCTCSHGHEGVRWSRRYSKYMGHCIASQNPQDITTTTLTTITTTSSNTLAAISATQRSKGAKADDDADDSETSKSHERSSPTPKMSTSRKFLPSTSTAPAPVFTAASTSKSSSQAGKGKEEKKEKDVVTEVERYVGYGQYGFAAIMAVVGAIKTCKSEASPNETKQHDQKKGVVEDDGSEQASSPRSEGSIVEHTDRGGEDEDSAGSMPVGGEDSGSSDSGL